VRDSTDSIVHCEAHVHDLIESRKSRRRNAKVKMRVKMQVQPARSNDSATNMPGNHAKEVEIPAMHGRMKSFDGYEGHDQQDGSRLHNHAHVQCIMYNWEGVRIDYLGQEILPLKKKSRFRKSGTRLLNEGLSAFARLTPKIKPLAATKHEDKDRGEELGESEAAEQNIATNTKTTEKVLREQMLTGIEKPQIEALETKQNELDVMTVKIDQKISRLRQATKMVDGTQNAAARLTAKKRVKKLKKKRRKLLKQRITVHKSLLRMKGIDPEEEASEEDLHETTEEKSSSE